ncbi:MAG: hypothetical protein JW839_19865 [Candidatus Lokiarchaeota archaeon]|nr:hypothetical protein [Candidatus Lokiarchaeota archaeon]
MRFLVLISPIVKFLINKYQSSISFQGVESDILTKFKASQLLNPSESKAFVQIIGNIRDYLTKNNIQYQRDSLKKLVGDGSTWRGFLNVLMDTKSDVYFCPYDPGSARNLSNVEKRIGNGDLGDLRVIMPMNLDESEEIYAFFHHQLKVPVYPMICNDATSKWLKALTFAPMAPRSFFFPEGTCASDYGDKVVEIARRSGITHFILKDEYDFDLRPVLPYSVVPTSKLDQVCRVFYEKISGIPNYGGLVLEEFLAAGDAIEIVATHIFNKSIRASHVIEKVKLKPYVDGGLYDDLIQGDTKQATDAVHVNLDRIDSVVAKYYPYLFSSVEYIVTKNGPRVIDVNSVSNTLKLDTPIPNLKPDVIFKEFIDRAINLKNADELEKQIKYRVGIKAAYDNLKKFGPAFFTGEKVISMVDGAEYDVKALLVPL